VHRLLLLALAITTLIAPALAQRGMGTLLGTVTDPSGVAIPGAPITITEEATGVSNALESDASGYYIRPVLKPGTYSVSVEMTGFKEVIQTGIVVQSASRVQANFVLQLGEVTETIEVTGRPPALQTATTQMGGTLENRQTSELPLGGQVSVSDWLVSGTSRSRLRPESP